MKGLSFILLFILSIPLFSQEMDESFISVIGSSRITVKPDMGVLNIYVSNISPKMNEAVKNLADKTSYYTELLKKLKFDEREIKTTSFEVSKNSVHRNEQYIDSGYIASQTIRLEFTYNEQILSKILNEFTKKNKEVDFNFSFKLSEVLKAKVQKQIIDQAVLDAKQKAMDISVASGIKLVKIKNITYGGWGRESGMAEIEREHKYAASAAGGSNEKVYNFTPDDLIFRDNINFHYKIE